ncbi:Dihydrolipoamide succinyltransferase component (E2) of 2-oxoglutarate dehydrogenase complex, partial [hydrothermal vent metagenome]
MAIEIHVPVLGESVTEATVGKWFKSVGDAVAVDEPICELETDKVALEVNATASGALTQIAVQEGDTVEVGALLATIDETAHGKTAPTATTPKPREAAASPAPKAPADEKTAPVSASGGVRASAAKIAADKAVDLSKITGTGPDGVVTKADVLNFLDHGASPLPVAAAPAPQEENIPTEEIVPMTRLRRTIA